MPVRREHYLAPSTGNPSCWVWDFVQPAHTFRGLLRQSMVLLRWQVDAEIGKLGGQALAVHADALGLKEHALSITPEQKAEG